MNITAFSLILLLLISLYVVVYNYYTVSISEVEDKNSENELLLSAASFRADMIQLTKYNGSYLVYKSELDPDNLMINLSNTTIMTYLRGNTYDINYNLSSLGIYFCDDYLISPNFNNTLYYNGTCVSVITS